MLTNNTTNPNSPFIAEYRNLRRPNNLTPRTKNKPPVIGGTITWRVSATVHDSHEKTVTVELKNIGSKKIVKILENKLEEKDKQLQEKIINEKKLQVALKQSEENRIVAESRLREAWRLLHLEQEKQLQKSAESKKQLSSFPVLLKLLKDPNNRQKANSTFLKLKNEQRDNFHQLLGHNSLPLFEKTEIDSAGSKIISEKIIH